MASETIASGSLDSQRRAPRSPKALMWGASGALAWPLGGLVGSFIGGGGGASLGFAFGAAAFGLCLMAGIRGDRARGDLLDDLPAIVLALGAWLSAALAIRGGDPEGLRLLPLAAGGLGAMLALGRFGLNARSVLPAGGTLAIGLMVAFVIGDPPAPTGPL